MRWILTLVAAVHLLVTVGCCLSRQKSWSEPRFADPQIPCAQTIVPEVPFQGECTCFRANSLAAGPSEAALLGSRMESRIEAEAAYAEGRQLLEMESPESVDLFYQSTAASWNFWQASTQPDDKARAESLYRSSLSLLLKTGWQLGRWDSVRGLTVKTSQGEMQVPVSYHGFLWSPAEFGRIVLVGDYHVPTLRPHRRSGWGVPLVIERRRKSSDKYYGKRLSFAATAVLRPMHAPSGPLRNRDRCQHVGSPGMTLEFHNPKQVDSIQVGAHRLPLSADLSAPFAWVANMPDDDWRTGFLLPGRRDEKAELTMLKPYQCGKIPIVFIHGLLSDPETWMHMANEIEAKPWYRDRYQIWAFHYPTGKPFLRSAATFRSECRSLVADLSREQPDRSLSQMVLVGHSMGGLVAKLQVVGSGEHLWMTIANRPIEQLRADDRTRKDLREICFFSPQPFVRRVIFLGTPHGGSGWAQRSIGRLGSKLVQRSSEDKSEYRQLLEDNPNTFAPFVQSRMPTSIDFMEPKNPLLLAIRQLPIDSSVKVNSISGTGRWSPMDGPGDGVVSVKSTYVPSAETELFVPTIHTDLNRDPDAVRHIIDVLKRHWEESGFECTRR